MPLSSMWQGHGRQHRVQSCQAFPLLLESQGAGVPLRVGHPNQFLTQDLLGKNDTRRSGPLAKPTQTPFPSTYSL